MQGNVYCFYIEEPDEGAADFIELCHDDVFDEAELKKFATEALFAIHKEPKPAYGLAMFELYSRFSDYLVQNYGFRTFAAEGVDVVNLNTAIAACNGDENLYKTVQKEFRDDSSLDMVGIYNGEVIVHSHRGRRPLVIKEGFEDPAEPTRVGPAFRNNRGVTYVHRSAFR